MAATAKTASVTANLLARCRSEPLVFDGFHPELCPVLEQVILGRARTDRSTKSLNVGGWKSSEDFFSWPDDAVQALQRFVAAEIGSHRLVAWAMVNRAGSHHPRHQHRVATLTGIYYVTAGSEDAITPTVFECADGHELEIDPHPGRLAIFRGETWHRVPVYSGDAPRITIAFDVRR